MIPQVRIYTAIWRCGARWGPTVFAHELSTRSARFDAENRLYWFALTVPARAIRGRGELPASPREFAFEFVGLVGLADPLRESAHAAVRECRSAGIRVVMITGDYPETAAAIARQAGLDASRVLTGQTLEIMDEAELSRDIGSVSRNRGMRCSARGTNSRWI